MIELAVAAVMFSAIVIYGVLGGADFGSGVWDLTAGNYRKGAPLRRLVGHSIGPVWEANHVWLIFVLVFLWSGFPQPFAAIMRTLAIPFWLVGLGVVMRGAGFAFRKFAPTLYWARIAGVFFAAASLITPFFLGTIIGGIASGRVPLVGTGEMWSSWLNPTSITGGVMAVATSTFLAGVLLAAQARSLGLAALAEKMRFRSLVAAIITGLLSIAAIFPLRSDAPYLFDGLISRALPLLIISSLGGAATIVLLFVDRLRLARLSAAVAVGFVIMGWGAAQYPQILVDQVSIADAAGASATLWGLLIAAGISLFLVVPPLIFLYMMADKNRVGSESIELHE